MRVERRRPKPIERAQADAWEAAKARTEEDRQRVTAACAPWPGLERALRLCRHPIARDIFWRVERWGRISEKQARLVFALYREQEGG